MKRGKIEKEAKRGRVERSGMKHGTRVRNMWQPNFESYLVYMGANDQDAYCLWFIDGKCYGIHNFPKRHILNDREHYPVVGYVDYEKVLIDAILSAVKGEQGNEQLQD